MLPNAHLENDVLRTNARSNEALNLLNERRSTLARDMTEPGPSPEELELILRLTARVPDHGKLGPWRFIVFEGERRAHFGEELARIYHQSHPLSDATRLQFERDRLMRSPIVVCVVSSVIPDHKIPVWEQHLCAGAACQNMLLSARALGYAAQWLTEWYSYDWAVDEVLGLTENERAAGFVYLGTGSGELKERLRPDWRPRTRRF